MNGSQRTRIESVFDAALDCPPAERDDFIARACGDDGALREAVHALLAAHERTGGVLEHDVAGILHRSAAPHRAGAYRIGRELGRGGMGAVFLGERADGQFHRRVAIKLIDTPADATLHARIVAERQILAALEHPNIARLLDGGITDDGRPFLVMEHVEGLPIDVFCDRMRLHVRARLHLFLQVVRAVEHAHRNLVVHRDLKPSNIMVSAGGVVKLLDFGIAKLLNPMLGPMADTHLDRRAFTPEYASPEQLRGEAVNTTSDVYSLGLVLYRLLAGMAPYAEGERPLPELLAERSHDPERPSTRIRGLAQQDCGRAEAIAHARDSTPPRLARALGGDLDAIVLMALRPEPTHRYGSAELLAQDIERYLDGRPVNARQGSGWYRLQRRVRRHRVQYSAALVVLVALVAGAGVAMWQARVARQERDRAAAALAQTQELSDFLVQLFETGSPDRSPSPQVTAQDLVAAGVLRAEDLVGQPRVQARMFGVLARVQQSMGRYADARRLTERALALHLAAAGEDEMAGRLLLQLGIQLRLVAEYDSATATTERARAILQRVDPENPDLGDALNQLRMLAIYRGDVVEGERVARSAYDHWRSIQGDTGTLAIDGLVNLALAQRRRGDYEGAEASLRRAVALRRQHPAPAADGLMNALMFLSEVLMALAKGEEADLLHAEVEGMVRGAGPELDHIRTWVWYNQAQRAEVRGDLPRAEYLLQQTVELHQRKYGESHPGTIEARGNLAGHYMRVGRYPEAERLLQEVLQAQTEVLGPSHPATAGTMAGYAELLARTGRVQEADSLLGQALQIRESLINRVSPLIAGMLMDRARLQARLGRFEEAEAMLQRALPPLREQMHPDAPALRGIYASFDTLYTAWGRPEQARRWRLP